MRITIFGATGLLGQALMRRWKSDEVTGLGSRDADLRDSQRVSEVVRGTEPDWIVLAAAYTDVDGCEIHPDLAFDVNCRGAVNVAGAASQHGARLFFISTDYVFDGVSTRPYETDSPRAPRSVYGRSKAAAEIRLLEILPHCCIVRTSWLFGVGGKCFPKTILELAANRPAIDVVNDQRGSPTYAVDLADAIIELCRKDARGMVHVTNRGECSWFEFAAEIVSRAGLSAVVRPITTDKFPRRADRPKYSVLSLTSLEKCGIRMPSWQDALQRYFTERESLPG
jgi:dTDP-4-dehydrorhamnose reductase